jgi:deoxyribose-phosphate aldolase
MRKHAAPHVQVKAAGGIRDVDALVAVRDLGDTPSGASSTREILDACRTRLDRS